MHTALCGSLSTGLEGDVGMSSEEEKDQLVRFGIAVPESLLKLFDERIEGASFPNRSVALRHLIREYVTKDTWQKGKGHVYGTVTLTYDHHANDMTSRLTEIQHEFADEIVCTTHVHADHKHCLEVIIVNGEVKRVKAFINALASLKALLSMDPVIATI